MMKKYAAILFFFLPIVAQAQWDAPDVDYKYPTKHLSGKLEHIFVFYDKYPTQLVVTDSLCAASAATCSAPSTFTWTKLNIAEVKLDTLLEESPAGAASSFTFPAGFAVAGGYRAIIHRADTVLVDTLTTWVVVDTFRIDTVRFSYGFGNPCEGVRLDMQTTPAINRPAYKIYNFDRLLNNRYGADSTLMAVKAASWEPITTTGEDFYAGLEGDEYDDSWTKSSYPNITTPPPLRDASYKVEVTDVFGKKGTYTTPYVVEAIAAYAKIAVDTVDRNDNWSEWPEAATEAKEALLRLRFSHRNTINANTYTWKGFADSNLPNGTQTVVWVDTLTRIEDMAYPRTPYKGHILDGYTPGTYNVQQTAYKVSSSNTCTSSASITITVKPSEFTTDMVPNAFTPNGDNRNDIFTFIKGKKPVSMEHVNVYIYNRSGGLVYRYEGRADEWSGWDGRYMGSGNDLAPGVYFYVINGEGWDGKSYNTTEFKGAVHLFR
jgi:gliding motility-associated-like protein